MRFSHILSNILIVFYLCHKPNFLENSLQGLYTPCYTSKETTSSDRPYLKFRATLYNRVYTSYTTASRSVGTRHSLANLCFTALY